MWERDDEFANWDDDLISPDFSLIRPTTREAIEFRRFTRSRLGGLVRDDGRDSPRVNPRVARIERAPAGCGLGLDGVQQAVSEVEVQHCWR